MTTIQNFGVPTGDDNSRATMLQPKIKYKFRVNVYNFGPVAGGLEITQQVQSVGRPNVQHENVPVHSYNSVAYYAGKPTFNAIDLVVRDDITNLVSSLVGHQLQKQMNHKEQTSTAAGTNYKFLMTIETLDGGNDAVLETWTLEGCFLESVNYGDFDYSSSEYATITMSVRFDNATQEDDLMTNFPEILPGVTLS